MKSLLKLTSKFSSQKIHSTTILAIKKNNKVVIIGDGQVTQGSVLIKSDARKIRELKKGIISGFAGTLADCLTLTQELEKYIDKYAGFPLIKPCIELAIKWRTEKNFNKLEASVLVVDNKNIIELDGDGNVLVHEKYRALGSGGLFAECATEALYDLEEDVEVIGRRAMEIAAKKCIYTNGNFVVRTLDESDNVDIDVERE